MPVKRYFFLTKGRSLKTILTCNPMMLFFVGIIEMLIVTVWTKMVTKTKVLASGIVTLINVMIWFYVIQALVDNINNWEIALLYAFGCAIGTAGSTWYFQWSEKRKDNLSDGL